MASTGLTKVFEDASTDSESLGEFINADSISMVQRRLADPIKPLSHYIEYMDSLTVDFNTAIADVNAALASINDT